MKKLFAGRVQRGLGGAVYGIILGAFVGWALSDFSHVIPAIILICGTAFFVISIRNSRIQQLHQFVKGRIRKRLQTSSHGPVREREGWEVLDGIRMSLLATALLALPGFIAMVLLAACFGFTMAFLQEDAFAEPIVATLGVTVVIVSRIFVGVVITFVFTAAVLWCCRFLRRSSS
ncbi:MAG: hypothetical protein WD030_03260 [Pirellulales bacterium]